MKLTVCLLSSGKLQNKVMKTITLIGLVAVNLLFWLIILLLGHYFTWVQPPFTTEDGSFYPVFYWGLVTHAVLFYFNALWLYPNRKNSKVPYWLAATLLVVGLIFIESVGDYHIANYIGLRDQIQEMLVNVVDENCLLYTSPSPRDRG